MITSGAYKDELTLGDNIVAGERNVGIGGQKYPSIQEAINDSDYTEADVFHQYSAANYHMLFFYNEYIGPEGIQQYSVMSMEYAIDGGLYDHIGGSTIVADTQPAERGAEATIRAELEIYLSNSFRNFLGLEQLYGAIPAWGIANGEWVHELKIEGQSPDEILPLSDGLYLWVYHNLNTDKSPKEVVIGL